jgi:hypothetical protein
MPFQSIISGNKYGKPPSSAGFSSLESSAFVISGLDELNIAQDYGISEWGHKNKSKLKNKMVYVYEQTV